MTVIIDFSLTHLFGFVQSLIIMGAMLAIAKVEFKRWRLLVAIIVIYVPYVAMVSWLDISMLTIYAWVLLTLLVYRWSFNQPWLMGIFLAVIANFAILIVEYIFLVFNLIFPPEFAQRFIFNSFAVRVIPTIFLAMLYLFALKIKKANFFSLEYFSRWYWILYFLAFSVLADLAYVYLFDAPAAIVYLPSAIITILFLIFFLHTLWYLNKISQTIVLKEELNTEQLYSESLTDALDEISGFRHDFANIIKTINGLYQQENSVELGIYLKSLNAKSVASMMVEDAVALKQVPILYGILVAKISFAKDNDINFQFQIKCSEINLKFCSMVDYSRIVGVLLDNAFEAAAKSERCSVYFDMRMSNNQLIVVVRNSCDIDVDIERIFERGYSTKNPPSGEGLYQVKQLLGKYEQRGENLQLNTSFTDGAFLQKLTLGDCK